MSQILFSSLGPNAVVPARGSVGAAGWDLTASADVKLEVMKPALVPTSLEIAIPEGYMLLVLPRSGQSLKNNLLVPNSPGLIDEDYRGHLQVIMMWVPNPAQQVHTIPPWTYTIKKGERIAQAVLVKYEPQEWQACDQLPPTVRGSGGFGSTGN
jgi:dUTP pyrophosphatase